MPSNIFANTGTNVSILFIDKSNDSDEALLVDASSLGDKIKEGKNQRTVLKNSEVLLIEEAFIGGKEVDDFSIKVSYNDIIDKNYSFSAGQYFDVKIEFAQLSEDEFNNKISVSKEKLTQLFSEGERLEKEIFSKLEDIKYGD